MTLPLLSLDEDKKVASVFRKTTDQISEDPRRFLRLLSRAVKEHLPIKKMEESSKRGHHRSDF